MDLPIRWDLLRASAPLGALALLVSTCSISSTSLSLQQAGEEIPEPATAAGDATLDGTDDSPFDAAMRTAFTPGRALGGDGAAPPPDAEQDEDPAPVPDSVDVHQPAVVLRDADGAFDPDVEEEAIDDVEGIQHLASASEMTALAVTDDGREEELTLLAVEHTSFRPLTPEVTAQAPDVWRRLSEGDVVMRHDVAHALEVELGGTVTLLTKSGSVPVRIGAFASNGAPPLADVLVPRSVARQLGGDRPNVLVVATAEAPEIVGERLQALVGGELELLQEPEPQQASETPTGRTGRATSTKLEPFTYTSVGDGMIQIHGDWVARNIVSVEIPGMGTTRCHRAMVPQLLAALQEVQEAGLYGHLEAGQFGGCFVPRHILFNPSRNLSMHAWGLAIDFNVHDNAYGATPKMDMRIVRIFERWGFDWGGYWGTPDGMHFELKRIVPVG